MFFSGSSLEELLDGSEAWFEIVFTVCRSSSRWLGSVSRSVRVDEDEKDDMISLDGFDGHVSVTVTGVGPSSVDSILESELGRLGGWLSMLFDILIVAWSCE